MASMPPVNIDVTVTVRTEPHDTLTEQLRATTDDALTLQDRVARVEALCDVAERETAEYGTAVFLSAEQVRRALAGTLS